MSTPYTSMNAVSFKEALTESILVNVKEQLAEALILRVNRLRSGKVSKNKANSVTPEQMRHHEAGKKIAAVKNTSKTIVASHNRAKTVISRANIFGSSGSK